MRRGSYRRQRSELRGLAPRLRLPGMPGCFGFGPFVQNQREQRGGSGAIVRRGGVAEAGWMGHRERRCRLQGVVAGVGAPDDFEILDQVRNDEVAVLNRGLK